MMHTLITRLACLFIVSSFVWPLHAQGLQLQSRSQVNAPHVLLSKDVQDWLEKHPTLHVGIWGPSQPPLSEGLEYGYYRGISADYLSVISNSLKLHIQLHYFEHSQDAFDALKRQEIQLISVWNPTLWPSPDIQASTPWLLDQTVLLKSTKQASSPDEIKNLQLGLVSGSNAVKRILATYPGSALRIIPNYEVALNAVEFGQIDALWLNRSTAEYLTKYYRPKEFILEPVSVFPALDISFGIDKRLTQLQIAINTVLQHLPLDSRQRIVSRWGGSQNLVMSNNPLALNSQEEKWLKQQGKIEIIIDSKNYPVIAQNGPRVQGFMSDVVDYISKQYGINISLLNAENKTQLTILEKKNPDALVLALYKNTSQEQENSSFTSQPLITTPVVVVMKNSVKRPDGFSQLKGEKLAILAEDPNIPWLKMWYPTITLIHVNDIESALEQVKEGHVRGYISPQFFIKPQLNLPQNLGKFYIATTVPVTPVALVMTSRIANNPALNIFNTALNNISPDTLLDMGSNWEQNPSIVKNNHSEYSLNKIIIGSVAFFFILVFSMIWTLYLRKALSREKMMKIKLANQLNFTQTLIDAAPVALYVRDKNGNLIRANQAWSDITGMESHIFHGESVTAIDNVDPHFLQILEQKYDSVLKKGTTLNWFERVNINNQEHYLQGWLVPWNNNHGEIEGLIGGWLDVTEKERLILMLNQTKTELEQAILSKNIFMQHMGHEIRTPLNAIIGLLELEIQSQESIPEQNENMLTIWESACNLQSMISDVFDVFRAENLQLTGTVRRTHLSQLVQGIVALYRPQAEDSGLSIKLHTQLQATYFNTDPLLIIRILSSILRKAIKHSHPGEIEIALYQGRKEDGSAYIPLAIEVCSQGPAISQDTITNVNRQAGSLTFKPEFTETGFTLATCVYLARVAGSELHIESDPDGGNVLLFNFSARPVAIEERYSPVKITGPLHILIVDDYPPGRLTLQQQLERYGHRVSSASDGTEALTMWHQNPDDYSAIITDITMPEMNGFELTQQIRKEELQTTRKSVPIFGLTALNTEDTLTHCLDAGMNECLEKPVSSGTLQDVLERYFPVQQKLGERDFTRKSAMMHDLIMINNKDAEILKKYLHEKNRVELARIAHRINGGARLLKFEPLRIACDELERACHTQESWDHLTMLSDKLLTEIQNYNDILIFEVNN